MFESRLVEGRNLAVDGTLMGANASNRSRVSREKLVEAAKVSRTVHEYLAELEQQNLVADQEERATPQPMVSTTDPDAAWAVKRGPARLSYYDNYLVDTASRVILSVEATPAPFRQEVLAARRMLEHVAGFGIRTQNLAADKAYGSVEFLAWLLARDIQPQIPAIDRRHHVLLRSEYQNVSIRRICSSRSCVSSTKNEDVRTVIVFKRDSCPKHIE